MSVAKIVEIVGSSNKGWKDAPQNAVNEAVKTIREIHGIEVKDITATINQSTKNYPIPSSC
jgi:dodecin